MTSIRDQIITAIVARLAVITIANGYQTDIGEHRFRAQKVIESTDLDACVVWPQQETSEKRHGATISTMPVKIEAAAVVGSTNPSVLAEKMLSDVIKCLTGYNDEDGERDPLVKVTGGLADRIEYTGGGIEVYPNPADEIIGVPVEINFTYSTVTGDPFNQ